MNFSELKKKALKLKEEAVKYSNEAYDKTANKLKDSKFVLKNKDDLKTFLKDWKKIVIFWDSNTEFYRKAIIVLPVIYTKSWANNFKIKMFESSSIENVAEYNVKFIPTMTVFKDWKITEIIEWEENILKLVKNLSLEVEWIFNK